MTGSEGTPGRLEGRVIAVTGATGIAGASAQRLATEGASVFTISRTAEHCESLHERIAGSGGVHAWATADLRNEAETEGAFARLDEAFGSLDGLLAVAGGSGRRFGDGMIHDMALEGWEDTLELNLTTTFLSMRESIRRMRSRGGGSVVIVSSVLASHPSPRRFGTHAYAVAKAGQLALVRTTAASYAAEGIRVNAIAPAVVVTPMSERAQGDDDIVSYVEAKQPLSGLMDPEPVAAAAAYLLSSEADVITGQVLEVDGGWSVTEVGA